MSQPRWIIEKEGDKIICYRQRQGNSVALDVENDKKIPSQHFEDSEYKEKIECTTISEFLKDQNSSIRHIWYDGDYYFLTEDNKLMRAKKGRDIKIGRSLNKLMISIENNIDKDFNKQFFRLKELTDDEIPKEKDLEKWKDFRNRKYKIVS